MCRIACYANGNPDPVCAPPAAPRRALHEGPKSPQGRDVARESALGAIGARPQARRQGRPRPPSRHGQGAAEPPVVDVRSPRPQINQQQKEAIRAGRARYRKSPKGIAANRRAEARRKSKLEKAASAIIAAPARRKP